MEDDSDGFQPKSGQVQESSTCYRSIAAHRCVLGAASGDPLGRSVDVGYSTSVDVGGVGAVSLNDRNDSVSEQLDAALCSMCLRFFEYLGQWHFVECNIGVQVCSRI